MKLQEIFLQMQKLPKGIIIDNPHELIETDFKLPKVILHVLKTKKQDLLFTRLSIKHLAEKGELGESLFNHIGQVLENPDTVHVGNFLNRFLISKEIIIRETRKSQVITIEITENEDNIIVTSFVGKNSYLKNLKLLWGTT